MFVYVFFLFPPGLCFPGSQYKNDLQRECCTDGLKETLLTYTCERRSEYIIDGLDCVNAFLHCCKEIESHRAEQKEEQLRLARSKRWRTKKKMDMTV